MLPKRRGHSLIRGFNIIQEKHRIDAVIVVDGGVDGIFRGDEYELGTPSMDSISMIAANESDIAHKYYCMTAFGSEGVGQEISHAEVLNRVSDLIKVDAYRGVSSLIRTDETATDLISASRYIFAHMPEYQHSNIVCSLLKAMDGVFGYAVVNEKTVLNPIWVSALTSLYWFFDLDRAARAKLYYAAALKTEDVKSMAECINLFQNRRMSVRHNIPI